MKTRYIWAALVCVTIVIVSGLFMMRPGVKAPTVIDVQTIENQIPLTLSYGYKEFNRRCSIRFDKRHQMEMFVHSIGLSNSPGQGLAVDIDVGAHPVEQAYQEALRICAFWELGRAPIDDWYAETKERIPHANLSELAHSRRNDLPGAPSLLLRASHDQVYIIFTYWRSAGWPPATRPATTTGSAKPR